MKASDGVRTVMKQKEVGVCALASRMGKSQRLVSERLAQNNITVTKLDEMLRLLDYKVVILPRDAKLPEGGIEIE